MCVLYSRLHNGGVLLCTCDGITQVMSDVDIMLRMYLNLNYGLSYVHIIIYVRELFLSSCVDRVHRYFVSYCTVTEQCALLVHHAFMMYAPL